MTQKYERKCWNCGSTELEPDDRGVKCKSCGATWNNTPALKSAPVTIVNDPQSPNYQWNKETTVGPSRSVKSQAARARGELPPKRRPKQATSH